jgi:4-hydroxy-tetrahydrodipicolinate reductase
MIKAIVTGAGGRMGGRIISFLSQAQEIKVVGAVEQKGHATIGQDIGEKLGLGKTGVLVDDHLAACIEKGDVVIDFTHHEASVGHLEVAREKNRAIVIGSTGFTTDEMAKIKKVAAGTRCVLSPNMSIGVNVMFKVLDYVAGILGDDYNVEIVEAHHNLKKDAPSGTAMKMAQIISEKLGRDLERVGVFTRKGMVGERTKSEIGIQTLRAGDIVGEHMVMFGGVGERLEFIHRAHSRDNFARGAMLAAKWIVNQKNGLYDMQDVLGMRGT